MFTERPFNKSTFQPLINIDKVQYWGKEEIRISDLEAFAKNNGYTNDEVWHTSIHDRYDGGVERYLHASRVATIEEQEAHKKKWEENEEERFRQHIEWNKKQKEDYEAIELKEYLRLAKKFKDKGKHE